MSLDATYDDNNIFAKIIRGEIPSVKLFETADVLAFMDVFPQSKGHSLIIHKHSRAVNLLDVDEDHLGALIAATRKVARAVRTGLAPDGIRIMQFNGSDAGQTIFHLHFHVLPIYAGAAQAQHASGKPADPAILAPVAEQIRAHL